MRGCTMGFALAFMFIAQAALAVGFQERSGADADGKPLRVAIWYPSDTPPSSEPVNKAGQNLAVEGVVAAGRHPLIIISHGLNGDLLAHADTALDLAAAGYVVAAVAHNGNTRGDTGATRAQLMAARPEQISRAIDYMLDKWLGHGSLDPARIGIFGFSYGGYTSLIVSGAMPDPARAAQLCRVQPQLDCPPGFVHDFATPSNAALIMSARRDTRIKAAVAAAPSYVWLFDTKSLSGIAIPIQLWIADQDRANELLALSKRFPNPPEVHVVKDAGHNAFARPGSVKVELWRRSCDCAPGFDRLKFHQEMNAEIRAFFDGTL